MCETGPGNWLVRDLKVICKPIVVKHTLQLRHSVLWPDKPLSHVCLPEDEHGLHFGAFISDSDHPVAVISFFTEPLPTTQDFITAPDIQRSVRFRKFACDTEFQGRGIGTRLLRFAFEHVHSQLKTDIVWCDARTSSADWYAKRGMIRFGENFFKGPVQYIRMYIDIGASVPVQNIGIQSHGDT